MVSIILFGKPGAGKGTQSAFIKKKYKLTHISTGDLFRSNIGDNTKLGKLAKSYIDDGNLVPDEVTIKMLLSEIDNPKNDTKGFIFDGFPRTVEQAKALDEALEERHMVISATIALGADDNELIDRLLKRGLESGRSDDIDRGKIENRLNEYNQKTAPLINFYKNQQKFHLVNGVGNIDEISQSLYKIIDTLLS